MNTPTILILAIPVVLLIGLLIFLKPILRRRVTRIIVAILMLPIEAFCVFGFLASFEGSDTRFIIFRFAYAALLIVLAVCSGVLAFGKLLKPRA